MYFYTETERLAHPQACLIPRAILSTQFNNELSEAYLDLMSIPFETLAPRIEGLKAADAPVKELYWLCIALSHASASDDELMHLATEFSIPSTKLFRYAALIGRLNIMNRLTAVPTDVKDIIEADDFETFCWAAQGGHLLVVERMLELASTDVLNMIKANNYQAFRSAANSGHQLVVERMITFAPAEALNMIKAKKHEAFRYAVNKGHVLVMEKLIALAPDETLNMVRAMSYDSFRMAAMTGSLPILERLIALAPAEVLNMIKAGAYDAFNWAASSGHIHIMERLIELAPTEVRNMVEGRGNGSHLSYRAFIAMASGGNLAMMERFMVFAPADVLNMIQANNYGAFREAVENGHLPVINRLLSFPTQIAFAEAHELEYSQFTHPYFSEKLTSLRSQRQTLETANPHAIFDVADVNDAKYYFYIIRNLIRRNNPTLLDDIRFLLEIPAVKALAHQEVTEGQSNELVRLALSTGNEGAAQILLTIPVVRDLAARNNYYRDDIRGALDLGALARDRESSMHALSTGEQERIAAATARYQPMIREAGVEHLFNLLLAELVERYTTNPAKITINGVDVVLPVDWEDFIHLNLTAAQRQEALKAYYQQKDHSALRYLSCPNHWMAPDAGYVYINEARTERWSTFEEYKPLIVMFWLAARDATIAPTDGHTLEGRIAHFVDELAQIGRAHNWDHSRNRVDGSGHAIDEEYDDLSGDKPSCFSGVKRRLFQSVLGHPLFKILTKEIIDNELRDFMRSEFSKAITEANRGQLKAYFDTYVVTLEISAEGITAFSALNIPTVKQNAFIASLSEKYGPQFNMRMQSNLREDLSLQAVSDNPGNVLHAFKFDEFAGVAQLLATPVSVSTRDSATPAERPDTNITASTEIKNALKRKLAAYIHRIEGHKAGDRPDYSHGFWFFKNSRAINREVNYLLANSLLDKLKDPALPIAAIFENTDKQRQALVVSHGISRRKDYAERGINSTELNTIIKEAIQIAKNGIEQPANYRI